MLALATTSRLRREEGEPSRRGLCVCREQRDTRRWRWQKLVPFHTLRARLGLCTECSASAHSSCRSRTAGLEGAARSQGGVSGAGGLARGAFHRSSPGRQRGQSRTQVPLSFGIASLAFKFQKEKGRMVWIKRCGLNSWSYPPLCRVLRETGG